MPKDKTHPSEYFVAGGIAGVVSRTCIAPIERVKILRQIGKAGSSSESGLALAQGILRNEGWTAFWKGNTAAVVRVMPYMSLTFLTYEEYRARFIDLGLPKQAATLAGGSLGGVTAVVCTYPLDLVRATMATPGSTHGSMGEALASIYRQRGVAALYSGVTATCVGVAPYAGLKFLSYEALKTAIGGVFGLKTSTTVLYTSTWDALSTIARTEGVANGLYRGLALNYLKTMPNVAIYMSLYDIIKMSLRERPL